MELLIATLILSVAAAVGLLSDSFGSSKTLA